MRLHKFMLVLLAFICMVGGDWKREAYPCVVYESHEVFPWYLYSHREVMA